MITIAYNLTASLCSTRHEQQGKVVSYSATCDAFKLKCSFKNHYEGCDFSPSCWVYADLVLLLASWLFALKFEVDTREIWDVMKKGWGCHERGW